MGRAADPAFSADPSIREGRRVELPRFADVVTAVKDKRDCIHSALRVPLRSKIRASQGSRCSISADAADASTISGFVAGPRTDWTSDIRES